MSQTFHFFHPSQSHAPNGLLQLQSLLYKHKEINLVMSNQNLECNWNVLMDSASHTPVLLCLQSDYMDPRVASTKGNMKAGTCLILPDYFGI